MTKQRNAERATSRELISTRLIAAPLDLVYEAWIKPEIFRQWWVPKSAPISLISCDMNVQNGGTYRLVFSMGAQQAEFFGTYREVVPQTRLVWTNDEGGKERATITTVSFQEVDGEVLVEVLDLYPSKEALDEAIISGGSGAMPEQLEQLEHYLRGS